MYCLPWLFRPNTSQQPPLWPQLREASWLSPTGIILAAGFKPKCDVYLQSLPYFPSTSTLQSLFHGNPMAIYGCQWLARQSKALPSLFYICICFMHILCCIAVKSRSAPILRCSNFRDWSTIILSLDTVNLLFKGKVHRQINILSLILTLMMFQTCKTFVHLWNTNEVNTNEVFYFIKSKSSLVLHRQQGYYHGQCTES